MFAVLSDAVDIVMRSRCPRSARQRMLLEESACWIASNDRQWPYSFLNICDGLGLEPDRLRSGLARFVDGTRAIAPSADGSRGAPFDAAPSPVLAQATACA
jgi:hypothetical protein